VVKLPPQARVFSSSEFCPNAGLCYGDSIISVQAHPEFAEEYELALLNMYSGNVVPEADTEAALEWMQSSGEKADTQMLAEWITEFFISRQT
jgi:GMP synthase-like glutamine amidotransferase